MNVAGSTLKWIGTNAGPMVWLHGTYGVNIDGLNLNGNQTPNLIGYMIDSDNKPTSQRNVIRNFSCVYFGDVTHDIPGTAIRLGTSLKVAPLTQFQSDGIHLDNFAIINAYTGVYVDSQNVDYTDLSHFVMYGIHYGVFINRSGFMSFASGAFGDMRGTGLGSFIFINDCHGALNFRSIQGESPSGNFLTVSAVNSVAEPITMTSCTVDLPIDIQHYRKISSIGCFYNAPVYLTGNDVRWLSIMDSFTGTNKVVCLGVNDIYTKLGEP